MDHLILVLFFKLVRDVVTHGTITYHLLHFGGLGGFPKHVRLATNIIWFSIAFVIWKERNEHIFQQKEE